MWQPRILTVTNIHLQRGATLVGYSGGKSLRGPHSAGVLLGRKDLLQAAWIHSAPHQGYAWGMDVGREEVVGMLVAIEQWVKGDRAAEWAALVFLYSSVPGLESTRVVAASGGRLTSLRDGRTMPTTQTSILQPPGPDGFPHVRESGRFARSDSRWAPPE